MGIIGESGVFCCVALTERYRFPLFEWPSIIYYFPLLDDAALLPFSWWPRNISLPFHDPASLPFAWWPRITSLNWWILITSLCLMTPHYSPSFDDIALHPLFDDTASVPFARRPRITSLRLMTALLSLLDDSALLLFACWPRKGQSTIQTY